MATRPVRGTVASAGTDDPMRLPGEPEHAYLPVSLDHQPACDAASINLRDLIGQKADKDQACH
jgi:hypothetical protein